MGFWRAAADFFFPPGCPACGANPGGDGPFCPACREKLLLIGDDCCPRCGRPGSGVCPSCQKKPPPFDRARSVFAHTGPAAEALQSFKYKRNWASGASLAKVFGQGVRGDWLPGQGLLAPVPLHPLRLWQRGFNQALILARGVDKRHGLRLERGLLVRKRHTKPQVGLGPSQRLANVQGAFALKPGLGPMVKGSAVVLVDDVFTTGATAGQCALALREAGASWVGVITLTRAAGAEA